MKLVYIYTQTYWRFRLPFKHSHKDIKDYVRDTFGLSNTQCALIAKYLKLAYSCDIEKSWTYPHVVVNTNTKWPISELFDDIESAVQFENSTRAKTRAITIHPNLARKMK